MGSQITPEELLRRLDERIQQAPRVNMRCDAPGYHSTGVAYNTILRSQAAAGRLPGFLTDIEDAQAMRFMHAMVEAWMNRKPAEVMSGARQVAQVFLEATRRHIAEGISADGAMRPLTERYAAIKKYKYHAEDKPILVRTGELLRALIAAVSVRK